MKYTCVRLFCLLALSLGFSVHAEMVKWVDDKGRVHFGDSVPSEYAEKKEVVELGETTIIAPESAVKLQNTRHYRRLKAEDGDAARAKQKAEEQAAQNRQYEQPKLTREMCRDRHGPNRVALRTACFRQAYEQEKTQSQ